jgi:hypothetical protein
MPKLTEVIEMFGEFGFSESEVRRSLAAGDSAHNAFEGLKILLELRWADMNQELSMDRLKDLKPKYQVLMSLKMTARKTTTQKRAQQKNEVKNLTEKLLDRMSERKKENVEAFVGVLAEKFRKMEKAGALDDAAKSRIRSMGLGEIWKDK